ncbi:NADP-dependent oxidoreductase [Actinomadura macrotermitis]|uniref:2-haloacrylate reductase n=1 Tax=Actinomadura macrotermitis TaxID=2585200 RepID=A0A7K0C1J6_9ACTN|nr:NADP-dependent oxidoreductase [Actinomadura macrotermitis]MQY06952.1 2-haloacrylate reductase [Actinomadura macrotermitis]
MYAITQDAFGGPEALYRTETGRPVPGPGEVLVQVRAAGVNPVDAAVRAGFFPAFPEPPAVLGWDVAGVVVELGPDVTRFAVGDEVFGMPRFPGAAGAYAEYLTAPAGELARKPAALTMAEAGGLPLAGLTAWQGLVEIARVEAGQRVLVHAAAGGVGHLAVQIAKARGAHVVATARAAAHAFVVSLGADEVVDYTAADFAAATGPVDVVLDLVGGEYAPRSLALLRPGGLLVTTVGHNPGLTADEAERHGVRFATVFVKPSGAALAGLAELAEAGGLRVHVERELPLADAAEAHRLAAKGGARGKTVLVP